MNARDDIFEVLQTSAIGPGLDQESRTPNFSDSVASSALDIVEMQSELSFEEKAYRFRSVLTLGNDLLGDDRGFDTIKSCMEAARVIFRMVNPEELSPEQLRILEGMAEDYSELCGSLTMMGVPMP